MATEHVLVTAVSRERHVNCVEITTPSDYHATRHVGAFMAFVTMVDLAKVRVVQVLVKVATLEKIVLQ